MSDNLDDLRKKTRDDWFELTRAFVERAQHAESAAIFDFLRRNAFLARPRGDAIVAAESCSSGTPVPILPLMPGDEHQSPTWSSIMKTPFGAQFNPEHKMIILKGHTPFTPPWKAMMLLHEGHHCCTFVRQRYDWGNKKLFFAKERETHAYQNEAISRYCGTAYDTFITQEADRLEQLTKEQGKKPGTLFFMDRQNRSSLDAFFGPSLSETEEGVRCAHFMIHTHFLLIERHFPDNYRGAQADFLRWLHEQG